MFAIRSQPAASFKVQWQSIAARVIASAVGKIFPTRAVYRVYFGVFTPAARGDSSMAKAAKAKKQTKSGAIRAYMTAHPAAGPTDVSKALKAKGIAVSPAHVSNVRQADKKGKGRRKRGRAWRRTATNAAGREMVNLVQLVEARRFAESVGGVDQAVTLLKAIGRLLAWTGGTNSGLNNRRFAHTPPAALERIFQMRSLVAPLNFLVDELRLGPWSG
jgi:hypothetical protein